MACNTLRGNMDLPGAVELLVDARAWTRLRCARAPRCVSARIEPLPVQLAEQERLAHGVHGHRVHRGEVGNGAGDAQDAPARARREIEALRRELQQVAGFAIGRGVALEISGRQSAVQYALAVKLQGAGEAHA